MNSAEFTYLLNNPDAVTEKQTEHLEKVIHNFPYFQSAHALRLKGLFNLDSYKYNLALKETAAHTTDRSVLFDFITSNNFTIIQKDIYEKKLAELYAIDVVDSTVLSADVQELEEDAAIIPATNFEVVIEFDAEPKISEESSSKLLSFDFQKDDTGNAIILEVDEKNSESKLSTEPIVPFEINTDFIFEDLLTKEEISKVDDDKTKYDDSTRTESDESADKTPTITIETSAEIEEIPKSTEKLVEKLELGKPIAFEVNEKHSFQEWLQLTTFKPINRTENSQETINKDEKETIKDENEQEISAKEKKIALIDKFIQTNPKITPARELSETPVKPIEIHETTELMTETLAKVFLEQKKYQRAIQAYEILILKNPEKSYFFADRIKDIKNLQQNNQ